MVARDPTDPERNLSLFAQFGIGDPAVVRFGKYLGVGMVAASPFHGRSGDELGLAVAIARNGNPYLRQQAPSAPASRAESSVELSYLAQVNGWLAVQPDVQYVIHPGTDRTTPNALVFTVRFELSTAL